MKRAALLLCGLFLVCAVTFGQDDEPGFGLQAAIFQRARQAPTNLNQNFSSMVDYRLTPGDVYELNVSSAIDDGGPTSYVTQLQPDWTVEIPYIGTVNVEGLSLPELRSTVIRRIKEAIPAQFVSFNLSSPAQYNVFVYGGVQLPGFVVATPLVTVIDAIAMAGGFKPNASYRKVQLRRGNEVRHLDLSAFYGNANFKANPMLMPGDRIFVPPSDVVVTVQGRVIFPGLYEMIRGETMADLLNFAGGLDPSATITTIEVTRLLENGRYTRRTVNAGSASEFVLEDGDTVNVNPGYQNSEVITVEGAVYGQPVSGDSPESIPGGPVRISLPYYPGISALSVLKAVGGPTPFALAEQAYVRRPGPSGARTQVDLDELWASRDASLDMPLEPGDYLVVPMEKVQIFVTGEVRSPGAVPFNGGFTVADYILAAGGFSEETANPNAIFSVDEDGRRTRIGPKNVPTPGTHIHVAKNLWTQTKFNVGEVLVLASWITTIAAAVTAALEIYAAVQ
jgi:protein involved in polysaccharide export with SLBB domain